MDISKIKPWNWFKKEQEEQVRDLPVKRSSTEFYGPLTNLHEEVDRLFNDAFRRFGMPSLFRDEFWPRGAQPEAPAIMRPNVDISAGKNEYLITTEVPGIDETSSKRFPVQQSDDFVTYTVDMADVPGWEGLLSQLRFDPIDQQTPVEIDYIRVLP